MGAWAAGMNMSLGMTRHGIVKSIGPDIDKLLSTLTYLGPSYRFLISGYPPFLKHLLDEGARRGFPWDRYEVHGLVGGEGMTEELRDVLLERFRSVYSGYGATDIEIGMAAESPVSVALRRLARRRPDVREALFGDDPRLPMVFQYNPLIHFLEVNELGEIICTVSRLDLLSPRIRYNVHDEGGLLGFRHRAREAGGLRVRYRATRRARRDRGSARPAALVASDPTALPLGERPTRRDHQRHGRQHLSRGHRDRRVSRPDARASSPFVPALDRR
jgi:phenylacetate-CoA ligase